MLDEQHAAWQEMRRGRDGDPAEVVEAVRPAGQRGPGLEAQVALPEVRIVALDVGRVAGHEVETLAGHRGEPVALANLDARRQAQGLGIPPRDRRRPGDALHRHDAGLRTFGGQRQRDGPGAGAKVEQAQGAVDGQVLEREFNQPLGLRSRDQRVRRDPQVEAPEAAPAREVGDRLAREAPIEADYVVPVPDSGVPAAIGFSQESAIPYAMGIIRNQYMGRTFIEPTESIRNMGVRLKLNVNRALIKGKRVILVDDSVVRGTTSRKIKDMILDAGAAEVHFRIASPPTSWPCFYGVDTPERAKLLAANMSEDEMRDWIGVTSLKFITLNGLYRAVGEAGGRNPDAPQYCDACFSGEYPVAPSDKIEEGFQMKAAE